LGIFSHPFGWMNLEIPKEEKRKAQQRNQTLAGPLRMKGEEAKHAESPASLLLGIIYSFFPHQMRINPKYSI